MVDEVASQAQEVQKPAQGRPRKRKTSTLVLQLAMLGVFLAVVWVVFGQTVLAPQSQGASVPDRLGNMDLVTSVSGDEALAQVDQLHGTGIDLLSARIVEYAGNKESATVWMGRAESQEAATKLLSEMVGGITRGGSGFSNVRGIKVGTHDVYQVDGPGGNHFFYQSMDPGTSVYGRVGSGTGVVWLTVQASDARRLLEEAMNSF